MNRGLTTALTTTLIAGIIVLAGVGGGLLISYQAGQEIEMENQPDNYFSSSTSTKATSSFIGPTTTAASAGDPSPSTNTTTITSEDLEKTKERQNKRHGTTFVSADVENMTEDQILSQTVGGNKATTTDEDDVTQYRIWRPRIDRSTWMGDNGVSIPDSDDIKLATEVVARHVMQRPETTRMVVLFKTHPASWLTEDGVLAGHTAWPFLGGVVLKRQPSRWKIISKDLQIDRRGTYGDFSDPTKISLGQGKEQAGFLFRTSDLHMGYMRENSDIYAMIDGQVKKVLDLGTTYEDNGGTVDRQDNYYEYKKDFTVLEGSGSPFFDIRTTLSGTKPEMVEDTGERVIRPTSSTQLFEFDNGEYRPVE